jgi:hypothetical protein
VAEICLTLITPEPRRTNPSEMFSAGVLNAVSRPHRLMGGSCSLRESRMPETSAISSVTTLVPFVVLQNSKVPFSKQFSCSRSSIKVTSYL